MSMCSVNSHIVFHVHLMKAKPLSAVVVHVEREKQWVWIKKVEQRMHKRRNTKGQQLLKLDCASWNNDWRQGDNRDNECQCAIWNNHYDIEGNRDKDSRYNYRNCNNMRDSKNNCKEHNRNSKNRIMWHDQWEIHCSCVYNENWNDSEIQQQYWLMIADLILALYILLLVYIGE